MLADVNSTKLHLLQGRADWRRVIEETPLPAADLPAWTAAAGGDARALAWDDDFGGIALLRQVPLLAGGARGGPAPGADAPARGAAADGFGNVFWIAGDGRGIDVQPKGARSAGRYWSALDPAAQARPRRGLFAPPPVAAPTTAAPPPAVLRGLAATTHHLLLAGSLAPAGLLVFDLDTGDAPGLLRWPAADGFRPWLIAATPDGGAAVLDFDETAGTARLWLLDRAFASTGATAGAAAGVPVAVTAPVGMAALGDGSLVLLDAGPAGAPARLLRLRAGRVTSAALLDARLTAPALGIDLTGAAGLAVVNDAASGDGLTRGRICVVTTGHPQAFELRYEARGDDLRLTLVPRALPVGGGGAPALVASGDDVLFASGGRWWPLEEQPRYRYLPAATLCAGQPPDDSAMVFDGKQPGCVWHRVVADACVPAGCEIRVRSRAADERAALGRESWTELHPLARRPDGSELPFERPFGPPGGAGDHTGTFETLIARAEGRYLELEITLLGDGRASPKLRALRVYYPRFSYLQRYLPAIYREDRAAADFLDRWLANPEGMLTAIEGRIAGAEAVLDPATAPPEYLDWLASWFGALLDPAWDEGRRRLFLKFAWLLYRWRGSALGLVVFLRLALDDCPDEGLFQPLRDGAPEDAGGGDSDATTTTGGFHLRVVEGFERRRFSAALLGDPTATVPGAGEAGGSGRWRRGDGGARLHALYRQWLLRRYGLCPPGDAPPDWPALVAALGGAWQPEPPLASAAELRFSAVTPSNAREAADWEAFAAAAFEFPYPVVGPGDALAWRELLARRYGSVEALNQAHGRAGDTRWTAFAAVALPPEHELPDDGAPLNDWLDFVALALPARRNAHRFTVLVPAWASEDPADRARRLKRAEAIVEAEKPAHTSFEVKPFWALFQAGSARVGVDTVLGESSRFLPLVLDAGYLRDGYLAADHPWTATDRQVIGRDRLQGNER